MAFFTYMLPNFLIKLSSTKKQLEVFIQQTFVLENG